MEIIRGIELSIVMQIILIFPPFVTAAPKVSSITEDGCLVEWTPLKHIQGQGDLHYRVSLTKLKDNEAKIVSLGNIKDLYQV